MRGGDPTKFEGGTSLIHFCVRPNGDCGTKVYHNLHSRLPHNASGVTPESTNGHDCPQDYKKCQEGGETWDLKNMEMNPQD